MNLKNDDPNKKVEEILETKKLEVKKAVKQYKKALIVVVVVIILVMLYTII